jgi:PAS domain S-box-containing protein
VSNQAVTGDLWDRNPNSVASLDLFRVLTECSTDLIAVLTLSGMFRYASPSYDAVLGYPPSELLGQDSFELVHPDDVAGLRSRLQPAQIVGAAVTIRVHHADGSWRWVEAVLTDRTTDPLLCGVIVHSRDITERKKVEAARRDQEEAERANRAKSSFLSRMSHELRTPLNAILGFAQVLDMTELTVEQRHALSFVLKGGRHLLDLINEVLDIARIDADRLRLSLEPVLVRPLCQECLDLTAPLATQRGIRLQLTASVPPDVSVHADQQRLKQVILNLVSNAIKYNRQDGAVTLSCQAAEDTVRLLVTDTGPGLTDEQIGRLFVPFERLSADAEGIEGTGLGLSLSKGLVEAMHGTIGVDGATGTGSTFWVELPRATTVLPITVRDGVTASLPAAARHTLLYIEDNLSNVALVEALVARLPGVDLLTAMQGNLGLDLAREHRPELIMLDLDLPDLPGDDVLSLLRSDDRTRAIPVVIISADATPGQIARMRLAGAADYFTKPLDVARFLRIVRELLTTPGDWQVPL